MSSNPITPAHGDDARRALCDEALANGTFGRLFLDKLGLDSPPWSSALDWNEDAPTLNMADQTSGPATTSNRTHLDFSLPDEAAE